MRKGFLLALVLVLALFGSACGFADSEVNEVGLIYSGGIVEDKAYQGILPPGATNNSVGAGSKVYRYRTDQRTFIAGNQENVDTPPVEVVSDDDVRLLVEYQLYFTLNQDEDVLRAFHENLGVKTNAWTSEGWKAMLQQYFQPQVERAAEAAALKHGWRDLFGSEDARRGFQTETVSNLKRNIEEVIGGNYFCGPSYQGPEDDCGDFTFTVGKPYPTNPKIVEAVEEEQRSAAAEQAQEAENRRITTELKARTSEVELYGPEVYAYLQAVEAAKAAGAAPPPFFGNGGPQPTYETK